MFGRIFDRVTLLEKEVAAHAGDLYGGAAAAGRGVAVQTGFAGVCLSAYAIAPPIVSASNPFLVSYLQEKLLKAEILELRQQRATLEDRQSQLSDDFAVMKAKTDSLHTLCRQVPVPVSSPYHPKQPPVSIT